MERSATRRPFLGAALTALAAAAFFSWLHLKPWGLTERDGYFHARYAQLLPERGLSRSFPWTQASPWRHSFADKEFLFHVLMAPFAGGEEPIRGALVFSILLSAGVFAAFYFLLSIHGARAPALFTLVLAAMGGPFLLRVSFLRAHVLSVLLILVGLHFLLRKDHKALAILAFLYSWSYSFPLILPLLAVPFLLGRAWGGERFDRRSLGACAGGVLLGLIVHPYAPHSLASAATYLDVLKIAVGARASAAVEVGREFAPYSTRSFLLAFPLLCLSAAGLGLGGWATKRKLSPESLGLACAATASFFSVMLYMRAIEYAAPLAAAALAFAVRDLLGPQETSRLKETFKKRPALVWGASTAAAAVLLACLLRGAAYCARLSADNDPPRFKKAASWMKTNMLEGETIVNLWWDDFPELFYSAPRQRFVVGLDPTYLLKYDAETAVRMEGMRLGRLPIDAEWLHRRFNARYMILRAPNTLFYPQLVTRAWRPVYQDEFAAIYALKGPMGPPESLRGLPRIPALE